jgi:uncharacterized membrane protein (DUF4010 family)
MVPPVGLSMVPRMFIIVVLPPPDGPRSITNSPLRAFADIINISVVVVIAGKEQKKKNESSSSSFSFRAYLRMG